MRARAPSIALVLACASSASAYVATWPSSAAVRRAVDEARRPLLRCVAPYDDGESRARYRVSAQLAVRPDGTVERARLTEDTTIPFGARRCARSVLRSIRLPPPREPATLPLELVLVIRPYR